MFRNHLSTALRGMARHRLYTGLNVLGLAAGMLCFFLILLYVGRELRYDRYHANVSRTYRITHALELGGSLRKAPGCAYPLVESIREEIPSVEAAAAFSPAGRTAVQRDQDVFFEEGVFYAEPEVFDIFSWPLLAGDPKTALAAPRSVVLTRSAARKYFGAGEAVGRTLRIDGSEDFTVTGVMEDVPDNSHFTFDMLFSFETLRARNDPALGLWNTFPYHVYLLLGAGADAGTIQERLAGYVEQHLGERLRTVGASLEYRLQPLRDIHLHSDLDRDIGPTGSMSRIYLLSGIAFFVLLMACINFVNLTVARAQARAREVGIRKAAGASRRVLFAQFMTESVVASLLAALLVAAALPLCLPAFGHLAGIEFGLSAADLAGRFLGLFLLAVVVGLMAGAYPALVLSSFSPLRVLRGGPLGGPGRPILRNVLVALQFAIAIGLGIATLTVHRQLSLFHHKNLGYDRESLVVLDNPKGGDPRSTASFRAELARIPGVLGTSAASTAPGFPISLQNTYPEGFTTEESRFMNIAQVDPAFLGVLRASLTTGREFSEERPGDLKEAAIINRAAAREFGWLDPIGKTIQRRMRTPSGDSTVTRRVVGVIEDLNLYPLQQKVDPLLLENSEDGLNLLVLRLDPRNREQALASLSEKWASLVPDRPFDPVFVEQRLSEFYRSEERLGSLAVLFSVLAVILGCMGLLGMSAHAAQRRTKEIGVRRVLGASASQIVGLLSGEFLILVGLANILAWPAAYLLTRRWLEGFAYRVDPGFGGYAAIGLAALLLAQATVTVHALSAARADPVRSLRFE